MTDVPDVMDTKGRFRRLVLSFVIAVVAATIAYGIFNGLAKPDDMPGGWDGGSKARAFNFVFYFTGAVFAGSFIISLVVQNALVRRKERLENERVFVPPAKVHKQ